MKTGVGLRASLWTSATSIFTSTATILCCALPALLVTIGAGAVLAGVVSAVPQLVWLSAHKLEVFGAAGVMLAVAGLLQWHAQSLPCPVEPQLAAACSRMRHASQIIFVASVAIYAIGLLFAFGLPALA